MRAHRIAISISAAVLMVLPISVLAEEKEEKEANSTVVTLEQLPPAVRKTIEKEAGGNKIEEIEKETENGKTVYEAEVTIDGKEWEIEVAEDGKLISKAEDKEDDDDAADDK